MLNDIRYGRERLGDIVENEVEEEAKEKQQDDNDQYHVVPNITLVYDGIRVKESRVTGNINNAYAKIIMDSITPHIEIRTKTIYSFKREVC